MRPTFHPISRALLVALLAGVFSVLAGAPVLAQSNATLPAELLDRDWKLLELQRTPGNPQSTIGANVTIRFGTDGKVSGSAGCNSFGGSYTTGANRSIQFSQLISTLKACSSPSVNTFEQEYLSALQSASSYTLDGASHFQLIYNNGQGSL